MLLSGHKWNPESYNVKWICWGMGEGKSYLKVNEKWYSTWVWRNTKKHKCKGSYSFSPLTFWAENISWSPSKSIPFQVSMGTLDIDSRRVGWGQETNSNTILFLQPLHDLATKGLMLATWFTSLGNTYPQLLIVWESRTGDSQASIYLTSLSSDSVSLNNWTVAGTTNLILLVLKGYYSHYWPE